MGKASNNTVFNLQDVMMAAQPSERLNRLGYLLDQIKPDPRPKPIIDVQIDKSKQIVNVRDGDILYMETHTPIVGIISIYLNS